MTHIQVLLHAIFKYFVLVYESVQIIRTGQKIIVIIKTNQAIYPGKLLTGSWCCREILSSQKYLLQVWFEFCSCMQSHYCRLAVQCRECRECYDLSLSRIVVAEEKSPTYITHVSSVIVTPGD